MSIVKLVINFIIILLIQCLINVIAIAETFEQNSNNVIDLNSGWLCKNINDVNLSGEKISIPSFQLIDWIPATVPGTVLTTLLNNKLIPDPFYGMNNEKIPDIYNTGNEHYTYWFVNDFKEKFPINSEQVWLKFRGINYSCEIYLNGKKLNQKKHYGMFLRQTYNITSYLTKDGNNRLAVIVFPPDPPGNPNGGQGGDGTIAQNITNQYTAGWDWIQPIRDRNTGIWDKVAIERTNSILLKDPQIITIVPGKRFPVNEQLPAIIKSSIEVENPTGSNINGNLHLFINNEEVKTKISIKPFSTQKIQLPEYVFQNPKLWWPNGYGEQNLYNVNFKFDDNNKSVLDEKIVSIGIREITTKWNSNTQSREVLVNGQKIFIKGGNWITSDAMLRFTDERYDAEVRFHRDMNLNLIRIWGGSLTERPEFYNACDKYGILVFQDFWMSGDCNGKWNDPMKKEDQWTRRNYPDDHQLFLKSIDDQVKMIRNHPSLAFYCGGNEIPPPKDILSVMVDSLLPQIDGTRYFFEYSNADSMSHNFIGGNGDGTYHLQPLSYFWEKRSFPFNSEVGSVGVGDFESLERFIPNNNLMLQDTKRNNDDSVWNYHKPSWYGNFINNYGKPKNLKDFADKAQLINYDQYRGLMEGHFSHMWDWYTGVIIWKTQNPWTALRGQMYDYYLDPNGGLYGLNHANKYLHVMYNPIDGMLNIVNHTFITQHDIMIQAKAYDIYGKDTLALQWIVEIAPTTVQKIESVKRFLDKLFRVNGGFLSLRLFSSSKQILDENLYWLPDSTGNYSGLQEMKKSKIIVSAKQVGKNKIEFKMSNSDKSPIAFFNRISLVDKRTRKRILPVFYSDNYISVLPGDEKSIFIENNHLDEINNYEVSISGWNVEEQFVKIK
ncbi:MAG: glycosyl hydrolase [Ignavibacteriae bacterium]|nr:glycosyl hydrolase [Ignavibacteriota bacterium]